MKNTLHAPAPWDIKPSNGFPLSIIGGDSEIVADCSAHRLPGIALANARLIASAPDLLDALDWALRQIEDDLDPDHQAAFDAARSTLRKAKGEA